MLLCFIVACLLASIHDATMHEIPCESSVGIFSFSLIVAPTCIVVPNLLALETRTSSSFSYVVSQPIFKLHSNSLKIALAP
jgi:hypothetical protein